MTAEQIIFLLTSAVILAGALMLVTTSKLLHAALWLVVVLFGVAVLYAILQASFLAVVQVVVYIGAIAILVIFAIGAYTVHTSMFDVWLMLLFGVLGYVFKYRIVGRRLLATGGTPPPTPGTWSLGLGLLISIVSDSERQAVQLSLLVLLASVFFSGFVLPISEFNDPVRIAAHAIPVTSAIPLIQDVMLRGTIREPWLAGLLAAIALSLLVACWLLLRRSMSRA